MKHHQDLFGDQTEQRLCGRVPYMTMQAFCDTPMLVSTIMEASADRRLVRADLTLHTGGLTAAIEFFDAHPTPDLLVIETGAQENELFDQLDALADVCDANTKVVLVGAVNDISFYRRLVARGITEYLVVPFDTLRLITVILNLFPQERADRLGHVLAFIGAKGGAGSSTIAQNTAWALATGGTKVVLVDLDLQFGTAALNYNIDAPLGFTEQLSGAASLDDAVFERMLHGYGANLSILAGATASREVVAPALDVLDKVIDRARATFPLVVLDLPHEWSPWVRQALQAADEAIVTAEPDLSNLRNGRMLFDLLKIARPNDTDPRLVLNRIGVPKRAEIAADQFAATLETPVSVKLAYEPVLFSRAANGGQMIAEVSASSGRPFLQLAQHLTGKAPATSPQGRLRWRRSA